MILPYLPSFVAIVRPLVGEIIFCVFENFIYLRTNHSCNYYLSGKASEHFTFDICEIADIVEKKKLSPLVVGR